MSDFAWTPDFPIVANSEGKILQSEMENGVKQYRQRWPTTKGSWKLTFTNRTLTETLLIKAFIDARILDITSFTWTCPMNGVEYTVRYAGERFSYEYAQYPLCNFELEFEEDLS